MEHAEEIRRWEAAQELYEAAKATLQQRQYRACVGLAYYASFQVMWIALGDPPAGEWRHIGITRRFCHGQWPDPPLLPSSLAIVHERLLALYELRLDAHYRAQLIPPSQAQLGLETVADVMVKVQGLDCC